jgi:imidazolonepropionase-like amidohydrolase
MMVLKQLLAVVTLITSLTLVGMPLVGQVSSSSTYRAQPGTYAYMGARLVIGDGSPPIEDGVMVVTDGYIDAVGPRSEVNVPAGAQRVDLASKTIMPTMNNVHIHIGYEGHPTWGPENFNDRNVLDHLQREAYYGVGSVLSVGSDPPEMAIDMMMAQGRGEFPPAAMYLSAPGVVPPDGGPDHILIRGTDALRAAYEVDTEEGARAAVRDIAGKRLHQLKVWIGDRRGSYPAMPPEIYSAVIDEAHKYNIKVHAHATSLPDQKDVIRAGVDVLVHPIRAMDEELLSLLRIKKPYWTPLVGFGDRSRICDDDPFFIGTLPPESVRQLRERTGRGAELSRDMCGAGTFGLGNDPERFFVRAIEAGARVVLGTDAGVFNHYTFGWAEHHELERYVQLGMTPAQAIVAATSMPAEMLGIRDGGKLQRLYRADFMVLDANPLDDIRNTRRIDSVYLRGVKLDRDALLRRWQNLPTASR